MVSGRSSTHSSHWSGLVEERVHAVRDRVAGGLVAGDGEHDHEVAELVVVEPAAVLVGVDQLGDDVVLRVLAALVGHAHGVDEDLGRRRLSGRPGSPGPRWRASGWTSGRACRGPPAVRRSARRSPAAAARPRRSSTKSPSPASAASLTIRLARSVMTSSSALIARGREAAGDDLAGAGVLRRVLVEQDHPLQLDVVAVHLAAEADDRAVLGRATSSCCSWRPPRRRRAWSPPSSRCRPGCRRARPAGSCSIQSTGAVRRSVANSSCGIACLHHVRVGEVEALGQATVVSTVRSRVVSSATGRPAQLEHVLVGEVTYSR